MEDVDVVCFARGPPADTPSSPLLLTRMLSVGEVLYVTVLTATSSTTTNKPQSVSIRDCDLLTYGDVTHCDGHDSHVRASLHLMKPRRRVASVVHEAQLPTRF